MFRFRLLVSVILAAAALGGTPAHAQTSKELALFNHSTWCATEISNTPGSKVELGVCKSNATSQNWHLAAAAQGGNYFQIVNEQSGLCMTWPWPNGSPDGEPMEVGNCVSATTQAFEYQPQSDGSLIYFLQGCWDSHGNTITLNDASDILKAFNPINGTYFSQDVQSERWTELYSG